MMKTLLSILLILVGFTAMAQSQTCDQRIADSLELAQLEYSILNPFSLETTTTDCHTLRVVVHVVYDGAASSGSGEITEAQVLSQIRLANMFFRNDSLCYDPDNTPLGYTLTLATTDPFGNPTTGITYTDGSVLFGANYSQYGLRSSNANATTTATMLANEVGWGADLNGQKYINSYIVPQIDGHSGGGVQAYAYLPTASAVYGNYNLYNTFGCRTLEAEGENYVLKSYTDRGLTWVHELGHNLGLFHTFQGETCAVENNCAWSGDRICDTPPQTRGQGCNGSCGFLSYNVMDYISEGCKTKFTAGQVVRSGLVIANSLEDYLVCSPCSKSADVNGDGVVNVIDVSLLNASFGSLSGGAGYSEAHDLNCDGIINSLDFSTVNAHFGTLVGVNLSERESKSRIYNILGQVVENPIARGVYIVVEGGVKSHMLIIE